MKSKPLTTAQRQAKFKAGQKALGRVQRSAWIHPNDWPTVKALIDRLNEKREKESKKCT